MSKKRASPGIGHNGNLPEHADIRSALAINMIFEEEEKKLRERKKRANKRIEGMGVRKDDMTFLKSLDGKTGDEIVEIFKRNWHLVGAVHPDRHEQLDIFAAKPDAPEARAAYYVMGLLKGLKGEDPDVPPAVTGDSRQQYTDGHNEGMARRQAAWELIGKVDRNEPIDGTGKTPSPGAAAAVGAAAAQDFAKDQGADPLVVGGVSYPNMRQANAARARLAAGAGGGNVVDLGAAREAQQGEAAVEGEPLQLTDEERAALPTLEPLADGEAAVLVEGISPAPTENASQPEGTISLGMIQDGEVADVSVGVAKTPVLKPDFHEWDEDYANWTGPQSMELRRWLDSQADDFVPLTVHEGVGAFWRAWKEEKAEAAPPAPQSAELPDEQAVAAGAKALEESGFAPKKARKPRNLAKDPA